MASTRRDRPKMSDRRMNSFEMKMVSRIPEQKKRDGHPK
jgi:hypothetical protein